MKMKFSVPVLLSICLWFMACHSNNPDNAVARVGDQYLLKSDLIGVIPPGTHSKDSVEATQAYIQNWIQQQLLVRKAQESLDKNQKNFDRQIENYRNSLIIFTYQNALVQKAIDTAVPDKEIEDYYNANKSMFLLKNNLVKVHFVKVDTKINKDADQEIYDLVFSNKELDDAQRLKLQKLCEQHAVSFFLETQKWIYFDELLKEIPIEMDNQEDFLRQNKMFQVPDGDFLYYVHINDYTTKDHTAPLAFERDKIIQLILNTRKVKLIESLHEEVMREGEREKLFEIY